MFIGKPVRSMRLDRPKILSLLAVLLSVELYGLFKYKHPDVGLALEELAFKYNHTLETHEVITEDGYILTLHHLQSSRDRDIQNSSKIPVLMVPGILNSAADFLILGPNKSLGFILADRGFDVWLGNTRGTTYSRKHVSLDPDSDKKVFWDFGIDEIGYYDLPAMVDYILDQGQQEKLHYVGFSQGTTLSFIMLSEKPQYNEKIRLISAITPAAFLSNCISPIARLVGFFHRFWEFAWDAFNVQEFFAADSIYSRYMKVICDENSLLVQLCIFQKFALVGFNYEQLHTHRLSVIYTHFPAGGSTRQINQYVQYVSSGEFTKYDFGYEENTVRYGQESPPSYNLSQLYAPVASYYADNDWMITEKDVLRFVASIPNSVKMYKVPHETFNHMDFLYGRDADVLLNDALIDEMKRH